MNIETPSNQVVFHTNGIIDPLSWEVIGMSAKEDASTAIGQFGSGLKFAIAVLLRNEHEIEIHTPDTTYTFTTETKYFRGKEFQMVLCNGKQLGITTDMGKHWKLWMAYRELVCNTMDEGGLHFIGDKMESGTSIVIKGEDFAALLAQHEDFFVGDREPLAESDFIRVYEGNGTIFYRGVKIGMIEKACFSYEILTHIELTEDRTFASLYSVSSYINAGLCSMRNTKFINRLLTTPTKDTFECELSYSAVWSDEFEEAAIDLWKRSPGKLFQTLLRRLRANRPDLTIQVREMTSSQTKRLDEAINNLHKCGYHIDANIQLTEASGNNTYAFMMGTQICVTEEFFDEGMLGMMQMLLRIHIDNASSSNQVAFLVKQVLKHATARFDIEI